jgi:hypothetical protein
MMVPLLTELAVSACIAEAFEHLAVPLHEVRRRYRIEQGLKWTRIGGFNAASLAAFDCVELLRTGRRSTP